VLRRYERRRRGKNSAMQHALTVLNTLFSSRSQLVGELRRFGMQAFNDLGPARRVAIRTALGRSLD
jgi:2-polyprenyl-6-methoxyphenol hydroxylase-like FAD-dependent oxidoreductase